MLKSRILDVEQISRTHTLDLESWIVFLKCCRNFANNLQISKQNKLYCVRLSDAISAHLSNSLLPVVTIDQTQKFYANPSFRETHIIETLALHATVLTENNRCKVIVPNEVAKRAHASWHSISTRADNSFAGLFVHMALGCSGESDNESADVSEHIEAMQVELGVDEIIGRISEFIRDDSLKDETIIKIQKLLSLHVHTRDQETDTRQTSVTHQETSTEPSEESTDILCAWSMMTIRRWLIQKSSALKAYTDTAYYAELQKKQVDFNEITRVLSEDTDAIIDLFEPLDALLAVATRFDVKEVWATKLQDAPLYALKVNAEKLRESIRSTRTELERSRVSSVTGNVEMFSPENAHISKGASDKLSSVIRNICFEFAEISSSLMKLVRTLIDQQMLRDDAIRLMRCALRRAEMERNWKLVEALREFLRIQQSDDACTAACFERLKSAMEVSVNNDEPLHWDTSFDTVIESGDDSVQWRIDELQGNVNDLVSQKVHLQVLLDTANTGVESVSEELRLCTSRLQIVEGEYTALKEDATMCQKALTNEINESAAKTEKIRSLQRLVTSLEQKFDDLVHSISESSETEEMSIETCRRLLSQAKSDFVEASKKVEQLNMELNDAHQQNEEYNIANTERFRDMQQICLEKDAQIVFYEKEVKRLQNAYEDSVERATDAEESFAEQLRLSEDKLRECKEALKSVGNEGFPKDQKSRKEKPRQVIVRKCLRCAGKQATKKYTLKAVKKAAKVMSRSQKRMREDAESSKSKRLRLTPTTLNEILTDAVEVFNESSQLFSNTERDAMMLANDISKLSKTELDTLSQITDKIEEMCRQFCLSECTSKVNTVDFKELERSWSVPLLLLARCQRVDPADLSNFFSTLRSKIKRQSEKCEQTTETCGDS